MTASDDLHALSVQVGLLPRRVLIDIARAAKKEARTQGDALGGPIKGKKRKGMSLRAVDTIRDTDHGARLRVQGVNPAAWVWMTTGTAPHPIRRRKKGPMSQMTVDHPGTRGRGGWTKVADNVETSIIPGVIDDWVRRVMG